MAEQQFTIEELNSEEWRDVPVYESLYQVSSLGRVKRMKSGGGAVIGRILRGGLDSGGYYSVALYKNGVSKTHRIHVLVASAFLGERPAAHDINHIDGCKSNNRIGNLEYITRTENMKHAFRLGLKAPQRGEKMGGSKLTEPDVREIIKLLADGNTHLSIAKIYGVSKPAISGISRGERWKHIPR